MSEQKLGFDPHDPKATTADLEKLMHLLREYTQKLREMCEEKSTGQYRRFQMLTVGTGAMGAVMVTALALTGKTLQSTDSMFIYLFVAVVVFSTCFLFLNMQFSRRYPMTTEAEQVAATVERLVKLASQYAEHSALRIGDRFEFELRLAEAEGSLQTFRRIFRRTDDK